MIFFFLPVFAEDNPACIGYDYAIDCLYNELKLALLSCRNIELIKDVRGVLIRLEPEDITENYYNLTDEIKERLKCIEYFLAKIKNPVIIEVHTEKIPISSNIKSWELSSVVAANIGDFFVKQAPGVFADRIYQIGYGEFLPDNINTPNNGGKYRSRVDIIVLCSINGE